MQAHDTDLGQNTTGSTVSLLSFHGPQVCKQTYKTALHVTNSKKRSLNRTAGIFSNIPYIGTYKYLLPTYFEIVLMRKSQT